MVDIYKYPINGISLSKYTLHDNQQLSLLPFTQIIDNHKENILSNYFHIKTFYKKDTQIQSSGQNLTIKTSGVVSSGRYSDRTENSKSKLKLLRPEETQTRNLYSGAGAGFRDPALISGTNNKSGYNFFYKKMSLDNDTDLNIFNMNNENKKSSTPNPRITEPLMKVRDKLKNSTPKTFP